jgi:predicted DsbA family dithiol-disulfide isomerase
VLLAHKLAMASPNIRSDMIEVLEFPQLVNRYQINAVPLIAINEFLRIEGAYPEDPFVERMMTVLDHSAMADLKKRWESRSPKNS